MSEALRISNLRFHRAPLNLQASGLHGWVTITLDDQLDISGIAARTTTDGRDSLTFPTRTDPLKQKRTVVRPIDHTVREMLEHRVFAELRSRGLIP